MTLGQKIQQLRKRDGLSQEGLAEQVAVTRQTISKWELDQSMPDLDLTARLSDIFQVSTDYLIKPELTQPEEPPTRKKRHPPAWLRSVSLVVLTGAALVASCICLICDYFTAGTLSWSWIAITSIAAAWLVLLPALAAKRNILPKTLLAVSLVPFPLLTVLSLCLKQPLVFTLGSCIALVSVATLWAVYGIFCKCRGHWWRGMGFSLLLLFIPLPIVIMLMIAQALPQVPLGFESSLFNSATTLILSLGCFGIDAFLRKKRLPKA